MSASRLLIISALTGCLRIYPDPELPDVEIAWLDGDCTQAMATKVSVSLTGIDDPAQRADAEVACADQKVTFADVQRIRFHITAIMRDDDGHRLGIADVQDTDLRDGLDQTTDLFFDIFGPNFSVTWAFEGDATCASLAAETVALRFTPSDGTPPLTVDSPCEAELFYGFAPLGTVTVSARALAAGTTVAEAPESGPLLVQENVFTDAGTLTLVPTSGSGP